MEVIAKELRKPILYFCEKRGWYWLENNFKSKTQVEYLGMKVDIQQTVSKRLAPKTLRDKLNMLKAKVNEHRQDWN